MGMQGRLERHGRALAVPIALACAVYFAASTHVPRPIPDFALRSRGIYRLEIGAAFFAASFLATMAVLHAFSSKGFPMLESEGPRAETSDLPPLLDLGWIKDPVERKEWEEMERLQRELEYFNRKAEKELREAGLI